VEQGYRALDALRANIENVSLGGTVVTSTVREFLGRSQATFDLVFIDPPWDMPSAVLGSDLDALDLLLAPDGEVVLTRRHGDEAPPSPGTWRVATDRRHGDTRIVRYIKEAEAK
jgi:16S rRNA (guanine966-N2)-methyltransferase